MVSGQTGSGLRSRKVDTKRALPVFRYNEVPDLDLPASQNKALLEATGVEKGEDKEHHLQAALIASHQTGHLRGEVIIPTPDASRVISDYHKYYSSNFHQPPSSIRFSTPIEDVIGCPYNLDSEDEKFIAEHRHKTEKGKGTTAQTAFTDDEFEQCVWALERAGDEKVSGEPPSLDECKKFVEKEEPKLLPSWSVIALIYPHWKRRRYVDRGGAPIQPKIKLSEDWLAKGDTDPYLCFRRREVKSVRKKRGRLADSQSLDKLRRLRDEMNRARQILELITNREAARKESIVLEHLIFEQRVLVRRLKKKLGIVTSEKDSDLSPDVRRRKLSKRGEESRDDVVKKIRIPAGTLRNAAQMVSAIEHRLHEAATECDSSTTEGRARRKKMLEESQGWVDITENPYVPPPRPRSVQCWRSELNAARVQWEEGLDEESDADTRIPFGRRRFGRGGRIHLDRHVKQHTWLRTGIEKQPPVHFKHRMPRPASADKPQEVDSPELSRWRFDNSDDEVDDDAVVTVENTASQMAYRVFTAGPKSEDDILSLMCKPAHPDQMNPRALTAAQRAEEAPTAPPQVIRTQNVPHSGSAMAAMGANGFPKKRPTKAMDATAKPPTAAAQKKRAQEMLDPKATIIKAMMQQAQRQAQQQQQQYQQMQAQQQAMVHGGPGASGIASSSSMPPVSGPAGMSTPTSGAGLGTGTPLIPPSTPILVNGAHQSPGKTSISSSFGPTASMSVQASPSLTSHSMMPGTPSQAPTGVPNAAAMNNQFNRQQQVRQQMQVNQMNMLRQHQIAQQAARHQQQLQQPPQIQQQHLPQQTSAPPQQLAQTSQASVSAAGLLSPNPNGFTPQQLFYYQHVNNPANQINLQQARAQAAMQNVRLGGLNQTALSAMMNQSNGSISAAQLQAYLAQQQQQQHQQLQQSHLSTGMSLQQHILNQQKLKTGAAPTSGMSTAPSPALNGVTVPNGVSGVSGSGYTNLMAPSSSSSMDSLPISAAGTSNILPSAQLLQQQQIQQQIQKQLQQSQQATPHTLQQQPLAASPHQQQSVFKPSTAAPSPVIASPAISAISPSPASGSAPPATSSGDANSSDKEDGPTTAPDNAGKSPHIAATKSAT
ncbi:hypothetical protein PhCBS80983_g03138 [Powellomyces hirtus]|uniref:Enhancer of polycomb-like protein n=1 Tax=Powellomyces hirtus TaxID=109895 RepID=A0A507E561_9FUNG|nr:hypothetical protein PhCBS80983_g03138 [Powellomyces hirtus]